jgi:tetratricopeptide (TPR) repeat protein
MSRAGVLLVPLLVVAILAPTSFAQKKDPIARELAVQTALQQGRGYLTKGQPKRAVETLEAQLPFINGNRDYLGVLRDAYSAYVRELQINHQDDQIPPIEEKMRILDGLKTDRTALPPPDPPPSVSQNGGDPFQQTPLMGSDDARTLAKKGDAAFAQKKYAEAGRYFAQAHSKDSNVLGPRVADWAYCRLVAVVERLNSDKIDASTLATLERETNQAMAQASGNAALAKIGQDVLARIRENQGLAPVSFNESAAGWTKTESANFRLMHHLAPAQAQTVLQALEKARSSAFEKWFASAGSNNWTSRCDVYVHPTADDYTRSTNADARWQGRTTFEVIDRRLTKRRIDLVGDNPEIITATIPREVTHVVVADVFPDPMLPRWAEFAMAVLAEPRENVQRYLQALPRLAHDHKLLAVGSLIQLKDYPDAATITAFYVQSVSLVDMLANEKGTQNFALFLQSAQRYGFERALKDSYGIKSYAALQEHWQKKAFAGQ